MQLRSLSIAVPTKGKGRNGRGCPNNCAFCVSGMDDSHYPDRVSDCSDIIAERDYLKRMEFCTERNFEAMVLTGTGEPLLNMPFIQHLGELNGRLSRSFKWIDLQTSGVTLNEEKLRILQYSVGVTGISLSLSSIFDSAINAEINGIPNGMDFEIDKLCHTIKSYGFNLRLSLNLWYYYQGVAIGRIFKKAQELGADQITFRLLYQSGNPELPQNKWIAEHQYCEKDKLDKFIRENGTPLEPVSFGAMRYNVQGISTILDDDCMSKKVNDEVRYLVLRPNCRLYTKWSTPGSLLF